jgi:hypothetical protein
MAGYRRAGAGTFTNATTINDQMDRQREDYQEHNRARVSSELQNLGVARDMSNLFPGFVAQEIYDRSVEEFKDLDFLAAGGNPDFGPTGVKLDNDGTPMFTNVDLQSDRPNKKGPNLIAPDINDPTFTNSEQSSTQFENRGFGWRDDRNEPGTEPARIGEYFSKHYKADGSNLEPPVLGEAKSPASDTNIDYDQP